MSAFFRNISRLVLKIVFYLVLMGNTCFALTIPQKVVQGSFVYGKLSSDEKLFIGDKEVSVFEGKYLFAVPKDAPSQIELTLKKGFFSKEKKIVLPVEKRLWKKDVFQGVPQKTVQPTSKDKKRIIEEQKKIDFARAQRPIKKGFPLCFMKPVKEKRISSPFGAYRVINGVKQNQHSGVDLALPEGEPVYATADGIVVLAQKDLFFTGGTILVEHGNGVQSGYSHLSFVDVKEGDFVKQGQCIGLVGKTGRATGPHLHFTLSWQGVRVAPEYTYRESCPCGDK